MYRIYKYKYIYIYLYILHYTIMHYMWNYVEYSKFGAPIHPELKSPFKVLRAPKKKPMVRAQAGSPGVHG